MLPSETTVSRQALLAGTTPDDFAASFHATAKEEQRLACLLGQTGRPRTERCATTGLMAADPTPMPLASCYRAVVVIVSEVDKLMHGSELLGDANCQPA